jgi:hypothetical protein
LEEDEDAEPEDFVDFVTVISDFYDQLEAYYNQKAQDWLKEKQTDSSVSSTTSVLISSFFRDSIKPVRYSSPVL